MILNELQYNTTKEWLRKFTHALEDPAAREAATKPPALRRIHRDAMESQRVEFVNEIREYEDLRRGAADLPEVDSIEHLPKALVRARIASGMTEEDLAEALVVDVRRIQEWESINYASADLRRIKEIIDILDMDVREEIFLPGVPHDASALFRSLGRIDLKKDFVLGRLLPAEVATYIEELSPEEHGILPIRAAAAAGRILDVAPASLLREDVIRLDEAPVAAARFKTIATANPGRLTAYTVYAYRLARVVLEGTRGLLQRPIPVDARTVRRAILEEGRVTFESALRYVWALGIPVLPLRDSGAFHGACWRAEGRNVIVLKQRSKSTARWLYDLLHEFRHVGEEPDKNEWAVVETDPLSDSRHKSEEERRAHEIATAVILDGRSEELEYRYQTELGVGPTQWKRTIARLAKQYGLERDSVANHAAWWSQQSKGGRNVWGIAESLQRTEPNPWQTARDMLLRHLDYGRLDDLSWDLIVRALRP